MIHRFPTFEIDEAKRELRAGERVLALQPRVFGLLVHLAKNRDRVVPKDELLDSVWPGVIVTDASLQRAVSLARAALAEAGAPDAIRTHARQGYRLCSSEQSGDPPGPVDESESTKQALERAHAAYQQGDWEGAIAALQEVDAIEGLTADDLQLWAHSAQCAGRPHDAYAPLERAVAAYTARGDRRRAAWVAILLGQLRVEWREPALARGWYHRATRLLKNEPPCREHGYLDLFGARMALLSNELESAHELARRAREAGEEFDDPDLEGLGLVVMGEAGLYLGRIREGLAALDEAGVSVVASGLSPWAGGLVYCGVIYSCITRADWHRASQWTEQFTRWCHGKGTAGYPGLCRMHRAEVLSMSGDLAEAEKEIRATQQTLARQAPWAEGDTWRVLGDILLARGDYDESRRAYERAAELGWESHYGLALLHLAQDKPAEAARLLRRSLDENEMSIRSRRGQSLAHYVIAAARAGVLDEARTALDELDRNPDLTSTSALQALLTHARAELAAAGSNLPGAVTLMRSAVRAWQSADAPLAVAETRCRLACLLEQEGDADSAAMELNAAARVFERAGADGLLKRCQRLRVRLSGSPPQAGRKRKVPTS